MSIDLLPEGSLKAELGGMRFTEEHRLVNDLISKLRGNAPEASPLDAREFNFDDAPQRRQLGYRPDALPKSLGGFSSEEEYKKHRST